MISFIGIESLDQSMVGFGLSNGAYTIRDVTIEMENTREYMDSKTKLTPRDHVVVAFYTFLIFMAFKYAVVESAWGFILVWLNVFFFDTYAHSRRNAD